MQLYDTTSMQDDEGRLRAGRGLDKSQSFAERKRRFASAAQALVAYMMDGKVEIRPGDIELDTDGIDNGGGILIKDRVSRNPQFQKMWTETSCQAELRTLARLALR